LGIDTIDFIIPSKTLYKFLDDMNLKVRKYSKSYFINQKINYDEVKHKKDKKVQFVEIGNSKNLSGYILLKNDNETINLSRKHKKANTHFIKVVFAGLRQPTKNIYIGTYTTLSSFIKRFDVNTIDVCFDGYSNIDINKHNEDKLNWYFKDYIAFKSDTKIIETSFYINKPLVIEDDTDHFKKVIVYDKYKKESRYKTLEKNYQGWKRVEARIPINARFKDILLDDYLIDVLNLSNRYFDINNFSLDYVEMQHKLLTDKRTHKGYKKVIDEV
jgi:hypothetical protein